MSGATRRGDCWQRRYYIAGVVADNVAVVGHAWGRTESEIERMVAINGGLHLGWHRCRCCVGGGDWFVVLVLVLVFVWRVVGRSRRWRG